MEDSGSEGRNPKDGGTFRHKVVATEADRVKARKARAAQRAEWAHLDLKQDYLDEAWMLECAGKAGIARLPERAEPASVKRLRSYARKMRILQGDLPRLVGFKTFAQLIEANPRQPLWALVCHLAECRLDLG